VLAYATKTAPSKSYNIFKMSNLTTVAAAVR
jgi:hypothetical protein